MTTLILGLVIFFATHALPMLPSTHQSLKNQLGAMPFRLVFSLFSAFGLALIIYGKSIANIVPVWAPAHWGYRIALLIMPVALVALVAAYIPNNFKRVIRHPMLLATGLWAIAHLAANGDLGSILLFGSFLVFSVVDSISANRRGAEFSTERKPIYLDLLVLVVGFGAFLIIRHFHLALFGVAAWTMP